ncbi:MAG: hypothetical protein ABJD07_00770 [Gemmatimonadaceae bacterium]
MILSAARAVAQDAAPLRLDGGRFTVVAYPADEPLGRALLARAQANDSFPGLARPAERVLITVAPDNRRFREWVGTSAPEWGAAVAFPAQRRIVMQGHRAGSDAGDPILVLRHELAHLALHEMMGDLAPRWFDEGYAGYAAAEWTREEVLTTSLALVARGVPRLDSLDDGFYGGAVRAEAAYALSFRAVSELASIDPERGLTLFFQYWKSTGSMDRAIRSAYGMTEAEFESRFRSRTMRRYGALAIVANVSLGAAMMMIVALPFYVVRRRRDRRRLAAMVAADDAAERAAQASAIAELLRGAGDGDADPGTGSDPGLRSREE